MNHSHDISPFFLSDLRLFCRLTHKHFQECTSFFADRLQGQRWRLSSEVDSDLSLLSQLLKRSGKRSTKSYSEGGTACNASPEWPSEDDARLKSLLKKTYFCYYSTYTRMSVSCNSAITELLYHLSQRCATINHSWLARTYKCPHPAWGSRCILTRSQKPISSSVLWTQRCISHSPCCHSPRSFRHPLLSGPNWVTARIHCATSVLQLKS